MSLCAFSITPHTNIKDHIMPSISFDAAGNVVSEDFGGDIRDPSIEPRHSEEALAAALPFTDAKNSPQQIELDSMQAREKFLLDKANAVSGYNADKSPRYVESADERARLLRAAAGLRSSMELQLVLSQRSIATDYLDKRAAEADLQQQVANHAALEQRAREIAFESQSQALAKLFMGANKMNIGK
jgi:hypothetical protein